MSARILSAADLGECLARASGGNTGPMHAGQPWVHGQSRTSSVARWTTADLADYMRRHELRENPLVAYGYLSIGCFPCTQPVKPGEDARSGRWAGQAKVECGIHLAGLDNSLNGANH